MKMGIAIAVAVSCAVCGAPTAAQGVDGGAPTRPDELLVRPVRIRVLPEDAVLFVEGRRVGNPLDLVLPAGAPSPRVEARREGYVTLPIVIVPALDTQRYEVRLERRAAVASVRRVPNPGGPAPFLRGLQTPGGTNDLPRGSTR